MAGQYKSSKLFNLDDRRRQTGRSITEVDVFQWKSTLLEELRKNAQFTNHLKSTSAWKPPKVTNRGFEGADAEAQSKQVDDLLTKIASYAPSCLVRAISKRTTCLEDIWSLVRDWAGIQTTGSKHLDYYRVKRSWKAEADESKQEFFYRLKDSMEDTLLLRSDNMKDDGHDITEDEDMTPCINSLVVMDWVDAIGGAPLVEHVHRVYAKDLETVTLGSLQSRISKNLDSLIHEVEEQHQQQATHINRVEYSRHPSSPSKPFRQTQSPFKGTSNSPRFQQPRFPRNTQTPQTPSPLKHQQFAQSPSPMSRYCKLCRAFTNHNLSTCPHLTPIDRSRIAQARQACSSSNQDGVEVLYENDDDSNDFYEDEEEAEDFPTAHD